jgi:hypothetical protein
MSALDGRLALFIRAVFLIDGAVGRINRSILSSLVMVFFRRVLTIVNILLKTCRLLFE